MCCNIGLCRTCEVFSAQSLLLSNLAVLEDKHFQGLSVTSERWLPLGEVRWERLGRGRGGALEQLGKEGIEEEVCLCSFYTCR